MTSREFLLALPYREGSVSAVADAIAVSKNTLEVISSAGHLSGRLLRFPSTTTPRDVNTKCVRSVLQDARRLVSRLPVLQDFRGALMYAEQARFDREAANSLKRRHNGFDVVIGLPQACQHIFEAAIDAKKILHIVNGHPSEHNRVLRELGLRSSHPELVPSWVEERVNAEIRTADLVVVPSQLVKHQLIAASIPPSKVEVVPYGVGAEEFSYVPGARRDIDFLYLGQISFRKGADLFVDLMRHFPTSVGVAAGPIVSGEIRRHRPRNLTFSKPLSRTATASLMQRARVLVVPSREDSFSLAALEGVAAGCGLVISNAAGAHEILGGSPGVKICEAGELQSLISCCEIALSEERGTDRSAPKAAMPSWKSYSEQYLSLL